MCVKAIESVCFATVQERTFTSIRHDATARIAKGLENAQLAGAPAWENGEVSSGQFSCANFQTETLPSNRSRLEYRGNRETLAGAKDEAARALQEQKLMKKPSLPPLPVRILVVAFAVAFALGSIPYHLRPFSGIVYPILI